MLRAVAALALGMVRSSIWAAPGVPGYLGAGLALIMLAIAAIDARCFIIPNELSAAGFALALVNAAVLAQDGIVAGGRHGAAARRRAGAVVPRHCALLYRRLRGRDGIGLGDVKLAGVAGAWLGWADDPDRGRDRGARGDRGLSSSATTRAAVRSTRTLEVSVRAVSCAEHLALLAVRGDGARRGVSH